MTQYMSGADGRPAPSEVRTEIEFSPPELGKLKLILQSGERGLILQISAERPETFELVRRNIETLQRTLQSEGVTLDGTDLGQQADQRSPSRSQHSGIAEAEPDGFVEAAHPAMPVQPSPPPGAGGGRLDMRF